MARCSVALEGVAWFRLLSKGREESVVLNEEARRIIHLMNALGPGPVLWALCCQLALDVLGYRNPGTTSWPRCFQTDRCVRAGRCFPFPTMGAESICLRFHSACSFFAMVRNWKGRL